MKVPDQLLAAISKLALPASPPDNDEREVSLEEFDVTLRRRGRQMVVDVPSREAESSMREMIEPERELDEVGSMQGFMVSEDRDDGSVELRIQRSTLIELVYQ